MYSSRVEKNLIQCKITTFIIRCNFSQRVSPSLWKMAFGQFEQLHAGWIEEVSLNQNLHRHKARKHFWAFEVTYFSIFAKPLETSLDGF